MPPKLELDSVRAEIFASLAEVLGAGNLSWEDMFKPSSFKLDTFQIAYSIPRNFKLEAKPRQPNLRPSYICAVDSEGACYLKAITMNVGQAHELATDRVCIEVKISMWEQYKHQIIQGIGSTLLDLLTPPKLDENRNKLLWKKLHKALIDRTNKEGYLCSARLNDDGHIVVTITCDKSFSYPEFLNAEDLYRGLLVDSGIKYEISDGSFWDGRGDVFTVELKLLSSYMEGDNLDDVVGRIVADFTLLAVEIDNRYKVKLAEYVAKINGKAIVPFDDNLGERIVRDNLCKSDFFAGQPYVEENSYSIFEAWLDYYPKFQCFRLTTGNKSAFGYGYEDNEVLISSLKAYALDHGVLIYSGAQAEIFLKPLGGDFDYGIIIPKLSNILVREIELYSNIGIHLKDAAYGCQLTVPAISNPDRKANEYYVLIKAPTGCKFGAWAFVDLEGCGERAAYVRMTDGSVYSGGEHDEILVVVDMVRWLTSTIHAMKSLALIVDKMKRAAAELGDEIKVSTERKRQISDQLDVIYDPSVETMKIRETAYQPTVKDDEFVVSIYSTKAYSHRGFRANREFLRGELSGWGKDYEVLFIDNRESEGDFVIGLRFHDSYLQGDDVNQIATKIDKDMMDLCLRVERKYLGALAAHVAERAGCKIEDCFDDNIGKKAVWTLRGGLVTFPKADEVRRGGRILFSCVLSYWENPQLFVLDTSERYARSLSTLDFDSIAKNQSERAKDLGFLIYQGWWKEFFIKPIECGDTRTIQNLHTLCQELVNEMFSLTQQKLEDMARPKRGNER